MPAHALDRIGTYQLTVTTTATRLAPSRRERITLTVVKHGTADLFYGCDTTTTTTSGALLAGTCGSYISLPTTDALYGIVAAGSLTVSVTETYDA